MTYKALIMVTNCHVWSVKSRNGTSFPKITCTCK